MFPCILGLGAPRHHVISSFFVAMVVFSTAIGVGMLGPMVPRVVAESPLAVAEAAADSDSGASDSTDWPQWRGQMQNGVASHQASYPTEWNGDESIRWRIDVPGRGGSTPIVAGQSVYLTAGVDDKNTLGAYDLVTGKSRWQVALGDDAGNKHRKGGGSNPSPVVGVTDEGQNVVVVYFRSGDVAGVDSEGKTLWHWNLQDKFGEDTLWWDLGSSPALVDGGVAIAVVQTGPSYLIKLDLKTGAVLWKQNRDVPAPEEAAQTYSTPLAMTVNGRSLIAMLGADHLTIHDAADGAMLASLGGFNPDGEKYFRSIASPVAQGSLLVFPYARGATLTGIDVAKLLDGKDREAIVWSRDDLGSDVPTPAVKDSKGYLISDSKPNKGTVSAIGLEDGETEWTIRLPKSRDGYSSSPLVAGDHLYVIREDATTFVIGPLSGSKPSIVAENPLPDAELYTVASPVPVGDDLLIRTRGQLYRIGNR